MSLHEICDLRFHHTVLKVIACCKKEINGKHHFFGCFALLIMTTMTIEGWMNRYRRDSLIFTSSSQMKAALAWRSTFMLVCTLCLWRRRWCQSAIETIKMYSITVECVNIKEEVKKLLIFSSMEGFRRCYIIVTWWWYCGMAKRKLWKFLQGFTFVL